MNQSYPMWIIGRSISIPRMTEVKCTYCGGIDMAPGFVEDLGQGSKGYTRWIEGPLKRGVFGGARRLGKARWRIEAWRCRKCGHLEMFAPELI